MPSGAKKRKAAKRKKELGLIHQGTDPASPTSLDGHPLTEEEGEEEKKEDPSIFEAMESSENGGQGVEQLVGSQNLEEPVNPASDPREEAVTVEAEDTPPPPLPVSISVAEAVSGEFVQSYKGGGSCEAEGPTEKETEGSADEEVESIQGSVTASEEVVQVTEPIAANPDASAGMDAPSCQSAVEVLPPPEEITEPSPDISTPEVTPTAEVAPAPLAERRASLCNCCGLFDVLMGSHR